MEGQAGAAAASAYLSAAHTGKTCHLLLLLLLHHHHLAITATGIVNSAIASYTQQTQTHKKQDAYYAEYTHSRPSEKFCANRQTKAKALADPALDCFFTNL